MTINDLPVSVIAGYLGSGKTTYINRRLKNDRGVRYAVLVNDFGDLNIDISLISRQSERSISLVNGCVCCTIAGDVDGAFDEIRTMEQDIDWVLFEASGVAEPGRLSGLIINRPGFKLYETLTLVDVTRIKRLLQDKFVGQHIRRQLMVAEQIKLTKTDLVSAEQLGQLQHFLEEISHDGQGEHISELVAAEHPVFYQRSLTQTRPVAREVFELWLRGLPSTLVRAKGLVSFEGEAGFHILQWVDGLWTLSLAEVSDVAFGQLLLIAKEALESLDMPEVFVDFDND